MQSLANTLANFQSVVGTLALNMSKCAQLANVVNEAALLAARRGADAVTRDEIAVAISRTRDGVEGNDAAGVGEVINGAVSRALRPFLPREVPRSI